MTNGSSGSCTRRTGLTGVDLTASSVASGGTDMTECQSCSARSELSLCGDCFGHLTDALAELPWLL